MNRFDSSVVLVCSKNRMHPCKSLPVAILPLLLAAIFFFPASQLQAGASNKSGNPYGNGTQFPNGTVYSATMRSSNGLVGIVEFASASSSSTNSGSNSTANNFATIYANGTQFQGSAFGTIDQNTVTCVMSFGVTKNVPLTGTNGGITGYTVITNNTCGGQFTANISYAYPLQTFSGTGQVGIDTNNPTNTIQSPNAIYNTTVTGCSLNN